MSCRIHYCHSKITSYLTKSRVGNEVEFRPTRTKYGLVSLSSRIPIRLAFSDGGVKLINLEWLCYARFEQKYGIKLLRLIYNFVIIFSTLSTLKNVFNPIKNALVKQVKASCILLQESILVVIGRNSISFPTRLFVGLDIILLFYSVFCLYLSRNQALRPYFWGRNRRISTYARSALWSPRHSPKSIFPLLCRRFGEIILFYNTFRMSSVCSHTLRRVVFRSMLCMLQCFFTF